MTNGGTLLSAMPGVSSRLVMHPPDDQPRVEALYEKLKSEVSEERGAMAWLRSRPSHMRVATALLTSLASLAGVVTWAGRTDFWQDRTGLWSLGVWVLAGSIVVSVSAALQPAHRPEWLGAPRSMLAAGLLLAGLGAVLASSTGALRLPGSAGCLVMGLVAALPTAGIDALLDRRPRRGLGLGALAGGLTGTLAAQLLCPGRAGIAHEVVMHLGPALVLSAVVGALVAVHARLRAG